MIADTLLCIFIFWVILPLIAILLHYAFNYTPKPSPPTQEEIEQHNQFLEACRKQLNQFPPNKWTL